MSPGKTAICAGLAIMLFLMPGKRSELEARPLNLEGDLKGLALEPYSEYLEDPQGKLSISDIKDAQGWRPSIEGPGFTASIFWVRFSLENRTKRELDLVLQQYNNHIDVWQLFEETSSGVYRVILNGDKLSFLDRPAYDNNLNFNLKMPAGGGGNYILRYETTSSGNFGLFVWGQRDYEMVRSTALPFFWIFYGFLIVLFLYNFSLFLFLREKTFLYFFIHLLGFIAFFFTVHGFSDIYFGVKYKNEFLSYITFISLISFNEFVPAFLNLKKYAPRPARYLRIFSVFLLFCALFIPPFIEPPDMHRILNGMYPFIFMGYLILVLYMAYTHRFRPAIYYAVGALFQFAGVALLAILFSSKLEIGPATLIILQYSFIVGFLLVTLGIADSIHLLRLQAAEIESRFHYVVENTSEILFLLDRGFIFKTANRSFYETLGLRPGLLKGRNFIDFLLDTEGGQNEITRLMHEESLRNFSESREPAHFRVTLKNREADRLLNLDLRLEYTGEGVLTEILGFAAPVSENVILKHLGAEESVYELDNSFNNAEFLSRRLTQNLRRYISDEDSLEIRLCLREMLFNAIEHGNLNMSFNDKKLALEENKYFEAIGSRRIDPAYKARRVLTTCILDEKGVSFRILDGGNGFDYKNMIQKLENDAKNSMLSHGRGLLMVLDVFDIVDFNEKGNEVYLMKHFESTEYSSANSS